MAILDANLPIFNRLPSRPFRSPFPSDDSLYSLKYQALLSRVPHAGELVTVGQQLLAQSQAQAWRDALALVNATKAQVVGDFLSDWMPKVAWLEPVAGSLLPVGRGLWAAVSFPQSSDPAELALAVAKVALDVALTAISAVPIVGQVLNFVAGIARFLYKLFTAKEPEPAKKLLLPWSQYQKDSDEDLVEQVLIKSYAQSRDWTGIWMPPHERVPWELRGAVRDGEEFGGEVFAPVVGDAIPWTDGLGCIPGTIRVAGHLQRLPGRATSPALRRFFLDDWNGMGWGGVVSNTGDFFPATGQAAGGLWQQVLRRGAPDMYKVDARKVLSAWTDYFGLLFDRVWQLQATKPWASEFLGPYICVKRGAGWSLGIPNMQRPHPAPFITYNILSGRGPGSPTTWNQCLWVEEDTPKRTAEWPFGGEPRQHPDVNLRAAKYTNRDLEVEIGDRFYYAERQNGSALPHGMKPPPGYRCVRWPTAEELLSSYAEPVEAIIGPACERLAALQEECLSETLVCAYVNEQYGCFGKGTPLAQRLLDVRKKLLQSKARMAVNLEDARGIDPEYAKALEDSGVPKTRAQRAAALRDFAAAGDPKPPSGTRAPPPPLEVQGGTPFDDGGPPPPAVATGGLGAVAVGMATLGAVGAGLWMMRRHRRPVPNLRPWLG